MWKDQLGEIAQKKRQNDRDKASLLARKPGALSLVAVAAMISGWLAASGWPSLNGSWPWERLT